MGKSWAAFLVVASMAWPVVAQPLPPVGKLAYPGTLVLRVDATDLDRKVMRVQQTLPVPPGPLVLYYPVWIPGEHANTGPLAQLAGLSVRAGGQALPWKRNLTDAAAFHLDVPSGVTTLDIEFQYLSSVDGSGGRVDMTREILGLAWNRVLLYPAGFEAARIMVQPSVVLPAGWLHASALEEVSRSGAVVAFKPVSAETLVDSPVYAGRHHRQVDLDPGAAAAGRPPVRLNIFADEARQLAAMPEQLATHAALVTQADRLFGARHFRHYDVLLALSESYGEIGLEHHQSSENAVKGDYFTEWAKNAPGRDLIPHEYAHSWNGKFRRPADLLTPHFNTPMRNSLLWVYEGQTQFWGRVLAARSGLFSAAEAMDELADSAAYLIEGRPGRRWRTLQDTTNQNLISPGQHARDWRSWQRSQDYYDEMVFVWAEADALMREMSRGQRSMDDFARAFFGPQPDRPAGDFRPVPYTFDDVVRALDRVQPFAWAAFLRQRLDSLDPAQLAATLRRTGWQLAFTEQPSEHFKNAEAQRKVTDFWYSLGLIVGEENKLASVRWEGPAFNAGLAPGATLVAVNGRAYKAELLKAAVTDAKAADRPVTLLVKRGDLYSPVTLDYRGGLRYPKLERVDGTADHLSALLAAR